jgi:hypothetical protein
LSHPALAGKYFRLKEESVGIELENGAWAAVRLATDSVVNVMGLVGRQDMVLVDWQGRTLLMSTKDIEQRGEEIVARRH